MPTIIVPVHAILTDPDHPLDLTALPVTEVTAHIKAIYSGLSDRVDVTIADGVATIVLPDSQTRLADRALARIAEADQASQRGRYVQAIRLYQEGLAILPDHAVARRQLGMAYIENDNPAAAKAQLLKAIQLNPQDAWAYLILGNLYYHAEHDLGSAERYFATAHDLAPDDPYVLNSYAGLLGKRGKLADAVALFERAIDLAPHLPTPRLGLAVAQNQLGGEDAALATLTTLFAQPVSTDPRHAGVYVDARRTYADLRRRRATASADADMQRMRQVLADYRTETGIEVRLEPDPTLLTDAKIELAWRTGRPHHAIKFAGGGGFSIYDCA
jgi:tetratricopeptide (TPR) repeat protein